MEIIIKVVGWGGLKAEDGVASEELKELEAPYTLMTECLENLSRNYVKFVTTGDKICGGYFNKISFNICPTIFNT